MSNPIGSDWNWLMSWDEYYGQETRSHDGKGKTIYRVGVGSKEEALVFHPRKTLVGVVGGIGVVAALVFRNLRYPLGIAFSSLSALSAYRLYTYRLTQRDVAKRQLTRAVEDVQAKYPAALRVKLSVLIETGECRFRRVVICDLICEQPSQKIEQLFRGIIAHPHQSYTVEAVAEPIKEQGLYLNWNSNIFINVPLSMTSGQEIIMADPHTTDKFQPLTEVITQRNRIHELFNNSPRSRPILDESGVFVDEPFEDRWIAPSSRV